MKIVSVGFLAMTLIAAFAAGPALADGDGEKVFKKCKTCHSLQAGDNKVGPSLSGVTGRTAGTVEGFKYSDIMAASGDRLGRRQPRSVSGRSEGLHARQQDELSRA